MSITIETQPRAKRQLKGTKATHIYDLTKLGTQIKTAAAQKTEKCRYSARGLFKWTIDKEMSCNN
jgi:hypothetical protein